MTDQRYASIDELLSMSASEVIHGRGSDRPNAYQNYMLRLKPSSRPTIRYSLQTAAAALGGSAFSLEDLEWHRIRRQHLEELVNILLQEGYAIKTCRLIVAALRGVLHEAKLADLVSEFDDSSIKRPISWPADNKSTPIKDVALEDIQKMLAACELDYRHQGVRDAAIITVLYCCGLKRSDIVTIDIDAVNRNDWSIVWTDKNYLPAIKWIAPEWIKYLRGWIELRNDLNLTVGPLFPRIRVGKKLEDGRIGPGMVTNNGLTSQAIYYIIDQRCKEADIDVTPRALRQACITNNTKKYGVKAAMLMAEHSDIDTTAVYTRYTEEEIRAAMLSINVP
jgi:integrase